MPILIDSHQDIAYNIRTFGRDVRRSAYETRRLEQDTPIPARNGETMLGWPEYQRGRVAVIFNTIFIAPARYRSGEWDTQSYASFDEAYALMRSQVDAYNQLCDESPQQFQHIRTRRDLASVLDGWSDTAGNSSHPVGLVTLLEGAEGVRHPDELAEWWEAGVRTIGMVWAGTRLCGGTMEGEGFTREGYAFLEVMADLGFTLDISHMNDESANQALDTYRGAVVATHANSGALLKSSSRRHLSDTVIRKLVERGGVMGIVPYNRFLKADWTPTDRPGSVTLEHVAAQVDYVCQLAGGADHVGIGTDFDGGFGWPSVPAELNSIADLQKLSGLLQARGYAAEDIAKIFGGNWRSHLERTLPE